MCHCTALNAGATQARALTLWPDGATSRVLTVEAAEGSRVTLECMITGLPKPSFQWKWGPRATGTNAHPLPPPLEPFCAPAPSSNDASAEGSAEATRFEQLASGSLEIKEVRRCDANLEFRCSTTAGEFPFQLYSLRVQHAPLLRASSSPQPNRTTTTSSGQNTQAQANNIISSSSSATSSSVQQQLLIGAAAPVIPLEVRENMSLTLNCTSVSGSELSVAASFAWYLNRVPVDQVPGIAIVQSSSGVSSSLPHFTSLTSHTSVLMVFIRTLAYLLS